MADNEDQPTRQRRAAFTKAAASIMEKSDDSDDHSTTKSAELSSDDESRKSDRRSKKQKTNNGGSDEDSYSSTSSADISYGSDKKKSSKKKSSKKKSSGSSGKKEPAKKKGEKPSIPEALITKIQNTSIKKLEKRAGVPRVCILALKERKKLLKELGQDTLTPIQGTRDVFDKCVLHHPDMVWRTLKCRSLKEELPYLLAATDKSEKQMTDVLAKSKALSKKIKEFREEWKANSSSSGDSLPVYAAKQLDLDPTPWMDAVSFVPVNKEAVEKAQGLPELNDMFQDEYVVKKPIEEKESGRWSVETKLKIQRSTKDNYHGVGKSESSLSIHNGVEKEVCGNANTKLWDWCNGEIPDEHKDKGFECKFLQGDASQSGPWNGVWLKNMRGFALATNFNDLTRETKEGKQKKHTAEQSVKGYLHKCGWKEARCNQLDYPAVRLGNPEREWFLFHKDFYPLGDGNEVVKNIDGCYYQKNKASK